MNVFPLKFLIDDIKTDFGQEIADNKQSNKINRNSSFDSVISTYLICL